MAVSAPDPSRRAGGVITLLASLAIALLTLRPSHGPPPTLEGGYLATDLLLNIILFFPLGLGLALLGVRPGVAIAIGLVSSTCIELAQLWVIPGRFASVHDVVTNGLGCALATMMMARWSTRARWWRLLAPFVAASVVTAWVVGSFLVLPAPPVTGTMWGQWGHEFNGVQFTGRVLAFSVQQMPIPDGRLPEGERLRDLLAGADTIRLAATIISGSAEGRFRSQVVSVIGGKQDEYVGVWQRGRSLQAHFRAKTGTVSLRSPWVRLEDGLPGAAGDTVRITLAENKRRIVLTTTYDGRVGVSSLRRSPDLFWTGFLPFEFAAGSDNWWLPLLPALPTLVLLGLATHRRVITAVLALAGALLLGPLLTGISIPAWPVLVAGAVSIALGVRLARGLGL
ncbi:MAG TPA: VanZ family protein [Gemmatimonadales bacterium]|nr:VanZ family protein [Gemmatimonadales bacterium]